MSFDCRVRPATEVVADIKAVCELELGLMSQVILRKTFNNMAEKGPPLRNSVTRNIFLKVNAKMGGVNNAIPKTYHQ